MGRDQIADAQDLYDPRSDDYDDSHHPRFARHEVELASLRPGEHVLDLCCGTGCVAFPASAAVGPSGSVTGIDVSTGMLAQAERKRQQHHLANVTFYDHSVTQLDTLTELRGQQFDAVICCSALVLFDSPAEVVKHWVTFLRPGGKLVVDVTHPHNMAPGLALERVGNKIGRPVPWYRLHFQRPEDLRSVMTAAGLDVIDILLLRQEDKNNSPNGDLKDFICDPSQPTVRRVLKASDADTIFEEQIVRPPMKGLASPPDVRAKAQEAFREEWARMADVDGLVRGIDGVYVGIGRKI